MRRDVFALGSHQFCLDGGSVLDQPGSDQLVSFNIFSLLL